MAALFNCTCTIHGPQCRIAQNFQREVLVLLNMLSLLNVLVISMFLTLYIDNNDSNYAGANKQYSLKKSFYSLISMCCGSSNLVEPWVVTWSVNTFHWILQSHLLTNEVTVMVCENMFHANNTKISFTKQRVQ